MKAISSEKARVSMFLLCLLLCTTCQSGRFYVLPNFSDPTAPGSLHPLCSLSHGNLFKTLEASQLSILQKIQDFLKRFIRSLPQGGIISTMSNTRDNNLNFQSLDNLVLLVKSKSQTLMLRDVDNSNHTALALGNHSRFHQAHNIIT